LKKACQTQQREQPENKEDRPGNPVDPHQSLLIDSLSVGTSLKFWIKDPGDNFLSHLDGIDTRWERKCNFISFRQTAARKTIRAVRWSCEHEPKLD